MSLYNNLTLRATTKDGITIDIHALLRPGDRGPLEWNVTISNPVHTLSGQVRASCPTAALNQAKRALLPRFHLHGTSARKLLG